MTSRMPEWRIATEAAEWAVRIDAGALDASERARLAEWLRKSPIHVDELLLSASLMAGLGQVDAARSLSIDHLLADVAPEVIPLFQAANGAAAAEAPDNGEADEPALRPPVLVRYWPALAASIALVMAVSWYGLRTVPGADPVTVIASAQTISAPGEEARSVALEDGSVVYLNAASRARVALTESRRLIELLEGQAMFDVAPDQERPFRVFAGDAVVQAVGTRFTVEHAGGTVKVVVLEGQVLVGSRGDAASAAMITAKGAIADAPMATAPLRLPAGRQAVVDRDGQARMAVADPAAPAGWQARQLSFSDEGLSVIAAEFNRYNALKIVVADADLARTRFSGVFDAHDPESFIAFLEYSAEIRVERPRQGQVVLTAMD